MNLNLPKSALVLTPKVHGADGISALTRLVACSLARAGVETRVTTLEEESRRDLSDGSLEVPVESAGGGRLRFLMNGIKAAPRARRPELVIATHLRMLPAAVPMMASGVPVVTFLLGVECWRSLTRRDRGLVARCERLLPISRWTRDRFVAANPSFQSAGMTTCPLGIDAWAVPPTPPVRGRALAVGRLWSEERYKGHDLLIDAWPMVQRACPHAQLMVVGDGDDRGRLESRARAAGLSRAIQFAGLVSQDVLRQHFADAQVFVLPSEGEGFGLVFLEAMRSARACVAAQGAAEEIILDDITGRIVRSRDSADLGRMLIELLQNPQRCATLGRAGRDRFDAEYSSARFATRFFAALQEIGVAC